MRIASIDLFRAEIPFHEPFRYALTETAAALNLFVRITADTGQYGWGEASPTRPITGDTQATVFEASVELGRLLLGADPRDIVGAVRAMRSLLAGNTTARSAFDMALHDLVGKASGLPLCALLGGGVRRFRTDNTIGIADPDVMATKARRFLEEGFTAIKVKLGTGFEEDVARVVAIRDAVGPDVPVRVDANQGWDVPEAIRVLREIEPLGIQYCEQPVPAWDRDGMRRVKDATGVPIMADEAVFDHYDAFALAAAEACDYLNIKLAKSGGLHDATRIVAVADAAGLACMVGCMSETRLGLSAAAHLVSARPVVRFADLDSHVDHRVDPVVGGMTVVRGEVILPEGPGHGADLDPGFLAGCRATRLD
jgi:L-alanine-DL-glutamate epimerase-like enolase superfamily enzyme